MKKKSLKLNFSKQTIANLDITEMNALNGGRRKDTRWYDCDSIPSKCIEIKCHFTVDYPCNSMGEYCTQNDCLH